MDALSLLISRFAVSAGVFYTGRICGVHAFPPDVQRGHLHLIEHGPVDLVGPDGRSRRVTQPTLLFLPRPDRHRLIADERVGAQVLCATVQFGGSGNANPVSDSLPPLVAVELADLGGATALLSLIAQEAFGAEPGAQAAVDRLCELLMIHLLRHCLQQGLTTGGTLAGLADARLAKALAAMHRAPETRWELESLASEAGMSRARFAGRFREVIGQAPLHYLAAWRIAVAQQLMRGGRPMKQVSAAAGYASQSAFTRAFLRHVGRTPADWLHQLQGSAAQDAARLATAHASSQADPSSPLH